MYLSSEDLKNWVQEMTEIRPAHLDQLKNGVAFCIIAAKIRGVKLPGKININAKTEYQSQQNFKVFQNIVFKDRNFTEFNIPNLVKGKIRNILHLLQQLREQANKRPLKSVLLQPKRKPTQRSRTLSARTMPQKQDQKKQGLASLNQQEEQLEELVQKVNQIKKAVEQAESLPKLYRDLNSILYKG